MTGLGEILHWVHEAPLPDEVDQKARLLVLDTLGCAVAAFAAPPVANLARRMAELDRGAVRLPGLSDGLAPLSAATLIAIAACWDEACEGLARAHGRPGVPVVAAAIALGVARGVTLGELIRAVVAGYEVGARMGEQLRMRPGMHVDAGWPSLGVAAGAARLLGLSPEQGAAAVELVASQLPFALYLPIEQGADGRNTYLGHAAWLGSYAALAVACGLAAPSGAVDRQAALALGRETPVDLGSPGTYLILEGYFKPFAAVRHVHYGAQAALELCQQLGGDTGSIEAIALAVYPEALQYCGNRAPATPIQAQFSLSFGVAAALRFGALGPEVYKRPMFDDPELRRLERLVLVRSHSEPSGGTSSRSAHLVVAVGGRRLECSVDRVAGDPDAPMSIEDCVAKFLRNAAPVVGDECAQAAADATMNGDAATQVAAWWTHVTQAVVP